MGQLLSVSVILNSARPATQQRGDRRAGPAGLGGDLRERFPTAVLADDDFLHGGREAVEGRHEPEEFLVTDGPAAGGRPVVGEPAGQAGGGSVQVGLQRTLETDRPLVALEVLEGVGQRGRQDLAEPGREHFRARVADLVQGRTGAQHHLLDDVGGVELAPEPPIQMQLGQHFEVRPERFQDLGGRGRHRRARPPTFKRRRILGDGPRKCDGMAATPPALADWDGAWRRILAVDRPGRRERGWLGFTREPRSSGQLGDSRRAAILGAKPGDSQANPGHPGLVTMIRRETRRDVAFRQQRFESVPVGACQAVRFHAILHP